METIGGYQAACRMKTPVMGIRVISDNEILNEEYDRESAIEAQKITLEIVKKYIGFLYIARPVTARLLHGGLHDSPH